MCSLFGLIDYQNALSTRQKNKILTVLSHECECRGTDATGIAYNYAGSLRIFKRPLPAHKMRFHVPNGVNVVVGHTRMATQGLAELNFNNHPFTGNLPHAKFAFAHNGVLWNDQELRFIEKLPETHVQTDSYVAVQLLEIQKALNFNSLKIMAEKVDGSFVFTVLDEQDNIWFIRGDNPLCIHDYNGFLLYASTGEILLKAEHRLHLRHQEEIATKEGDILRIDKNGDIEHGEFLPLQTFRHPWRQFPCWRQRYWQTENEPEVGIYDDLLDVAKAMGVSDDDIEILLDYGCESDEIEDLLYDPALLNEVLYELRSAYI